MKKIVVINGSPKRDGNTATLVRWFCEGARKKGSRPEVVSPAFMRFAVNGCISCRRCQKRRAYGCVIRDDAAPVLRKMAKADVIVFATPLYFFGASCQTKLILDRMFSLFKWDNRAGTMKTPLKGKTMCLIASAYESTGMDCLRKPFQITASYAGMKFLSLLVPDAGISGYIVKKKGVMARAVAFGKKAAG